MTEYRCFFYYLELLVTQRGFQFLMTLASVEHLDEVSLSSIFCLKKKNSKKIVKLLFQNL